MKNYLIALMIVAVTICVTYFSLTAAKKNKKENWTKDYMFAHRGLHNELFPENSLLAIKAAAEKGFAVETDVHLTKDKRLIVFHDYSLLRMTGVDKIIEDCTFEELRKYRLGASDEIIPTFEEVLDLIDGEVPLLIETKTEGRAGELEMKLYSALKAYKGKVAVQSFSPFSIGWFYKNAPEILRGQLSYCFSKGAEHISLISRFFLKHLFTNFLCRPNFISYEKNSISNVVIRRLKKFQIPILAWTITSKDEYENVKSSATSIIFEQFTPNGSEK